MLVTQMPNKLKKLRLWRILTEKKLNELARDVRLPAYVVSAIERGEVEPSPRWVRRFEDAFGREIAADLLSDVDPVEALGPLSGTLRK